MKTISRCRDVHDRATEVAIREAIFERFPESVVLGEETGWSNRTGDAGEPSPNDLIWIVDPIDGTSNFAGGWDYWCISISAARDGEFVASGVCQPIVNRIWSADDTGAYLDEPGYETPQALRPAGRCSFGWSVRHGIPKDQHC